MTDYIPYCDILYIIILIMEVLTLPQCCAVKVHQQPFARVEYEALSTLNSGKEVSELGANKR